MKYDIVLCGVGGQGVLSMAALIGQAALMDGLSAKQSEIHGMAQRGGAVSAHLRLASHPIASDLVPRGWADLILGLEPIEALRTLPYLSPDGALVTASDPFVNIPDYPPIERVLSSIRSLPRAILVEAERLARAAGDVQAMNTVVVGAAAHLLPVRRESLEKVIERAFGRKGDQTLRVNRAAFAASARVLV
jgi:indolepyruvate ferredoxin oxidoreductase, beta subunit